MNEALSPALEICTKSEDRLREVERLLLEARPETLDRAAAELADVIGGLREIAMARPLDPALRTPLKRIQFRTRILSRQAAHASNLYMGFVQLRHANGYTRQGTPNVHHGARNTVEA